MSSRKLLTDTSRTIFLIGFSGSGKSTVGPLLARRLNAQFLDIDSMIEAQTRKKIAELFAHEGETVFRTLERDLIRQISGNDRSARVIALGGGAFQDRGNRQLLLASGVTVYLQCSVREIYRRLRQSVDRPLLATESASPGRDKIAALLAARRDTYRLADITVSTSSRTPKETVDLIDMKLKEKYGTDKG